MRRSETQIPLGSSFSAELSDNQVAYSDNSELVGSNSFVFSTDGLVLSRPIKTSDSFQLFNNNYTLGFYPSLSLAQSYNLYWPATSGSSGSVLINKGGGQLDWASSTSVLTANDTVILAGNPKSVLYVNADQKLAQSVNFLWDYDTGYLTTSGYQVSGLAPTSSFLKGNGTAYTAGYITASDIPSGIDASKIADGTVSNTEFQYLNSVTSNVQTQLDNKQPLDATLTSLAALSSSIGFLYQTGADTFSKYTVSGTANEIDIDDSGSVLTFSLPLTPTVSGLKLSSLLDGCFVYNSTANGLSTNANFQFNGTEAGFGGALSSGVRLTITGTDTTSGSYGLRVWPSAGAAYFTCRNDGVVAAIGQFTASRTAGDSVYAAIVSHSGGTSNRHGLQVSSTGTGTNTIAFNVGTGATSEAVNVDGAGNTGFGLVPNGSHRVQIRGGSNTSATDALKISNSDTTTILEVQNNGYVGIGTTSTIGKVSIANTQTDVTIGGLVTTNTFTGTDATTRSNYGINATLNATTNLSAAHAGYGGLFTLQPLVASGQTNSGINAGVYSNASISTSVHQGTLSGLYAGYFRHGAASAATGSGIVTNSFGLYVLTDFNSASTSIGASYGCRLAGSGTARYPTLLWGIYEEYSAASAAANYFASPIQIGTTSRSANITLSRNQSLAAWGANGINTRFGSATFTDTSTVSGVVASNAVNSFGGGVLATSVTGITYTNAHTVYIHAAPTAGTNTPTLTNTWSLWINTGASKLNNTFIGGSYGTNTNANMLSGSGFTGLQLRNTSSVLAGLEFFNESNSLSTGSVIGRIGWWGGSSTPRENARIEALIVGTSENAADIVLSTATAGTLTERMRILSTGTINVTGFTGTGNKVVLAGATGDLSALTVGTSAQFLRGDGTWQTPAGTGTVTSVALALPAEFSITGSPVTTTGTLTGAWATQVSALVFASPVSGAAAAPTFRALVAGDIPTLPWSKLTSTPTTLAGYGISDAQGLDATLTALAALDATAGILYQTGADAFTKVSSGTFATSGHTHAFSDLTSKPTTLSGYGITDAQGLDATLTALAALDATAGLLYQTGADAFTKVSSGSFSASGHTHAFADLTSKPTTLSGYGISDSTTNLSEGTNLYYTDARVRACTLTGFASSNSVVTASDTVLGSIGKLQGQISAKKERRTLVFFSAYTPTASGADDVQIPIPRLADAGTNWTPKKLRVRVNTASAGTTTVRCEYYNGTSAFSATNIHTGGDVSLSGGSTYEASTTTFSTTTLASDAWLRINFTALDATHAKFTVYLEIEEQ